MPAHARARCWSRPPRPRSTACARTREGSPASRIHWPALARGAGLMERKLISEADSRPLVVLDPRAPGSQEALDAAVRAAASLTLHFARRSGCALLLPGDRRATSSSPTCSGWPPAHVRLALVGRAHRPGAGRRPEPPRADRLVAARAVDRAPRGLGRTPGGCLLVVPGALAGRRAVIEVAGCHGYVAGRAGRRRGDRGAGGARGVSFARRPRYDPRRGAGRRAATGAAATLPRTPSPAASASWRSAASGALHWMLMLEPGAAGARAGRVVGVGAARGARAARRRPAARARARALAALGARSSPLAALALLAGGVPAELLRPDRWGELRGRRSRAASRTLPGVRVPYRGLDQWVRIVIPLGGTRARAVGRAARVLAAARARRAPGRRARAAVRALRGAGRRARLPRRVPARRAARPARARLPAAGEAAHAGRRPPPARWPCSSPSRR